MQFAHDPNVQDALAALVDAGIKGATTALQRWYTEGGERLPEAGELFVVIDSRRAPRCICRMTSVEIRRFADVDAAFAWDEGEDDRSLASWRAIHERFFAKEARDGGFSFDGASPVVLPRFERIAP